MYFMRTTFILVLLVIPGCFRPRMTPAAMERGYVLMLPGVECYNWTMSGMAHGLCEAGIDRAMEINLWGGRPFGTFPNLRHYPENRKKAARLADMLVRYRQDHPTAPITL